MASERRSLTPGEGRYAFVDTEEPTRPGVPKPIDRWDTMAHLLANLEPDERRRLLLLADAWFEAFASRCAKH